MIMKPEFWLSERITLRRHLQESVMTSGAPWFVAVEAVASLFLEHPEIDPDVVRTRQEWLDRDDDL